MTTPNESPNKDEENNEDSVRPVDRDRDNAAFDELVASMPELAELAPPSAFGAVTETVELQVPSFDGSDATTTISIDVPAELAPMIRAEFSPERVEAITAMMKLLLAQPGAGPMS